MVNSVKTLWSTLCETAQLTGSQRKLWWPFAITACVELLLIALIWLAPQSPLSSVLAPPIRFFFGERVLHYPWHLWFLYHAMKHTHLVASTLIGAFLSGVACVMVRQVRDGQVPSLRAALISRQVRYPTVLALWLTTWILAQGVSEIVNRVAPKSIEALWVGIGLTVMLQAAFVYAIPAAVYNREGWKTALIHSLRETLRHPLSTALIVSVPSAIVIAWSIIASEGRVAHWMLATIPEVAILFVAARLLMWTIADAVITVAAAHLWWVHRVEERDSQVVHLPAARRGARRTLAVAKEGSAVA